MKLAWTFRAERCLRQIGDRIAEDDPIAATRWIKRLRAAMKRASRMPGIGRSVPELGRADVREVLVGNYRLIYRVSPRDVIALYVTDGHKLLPDDVG